jgi:hypothetical protein
MSLKRVLNLICYCFLPLALTNCSFNQERTLVKLREKRQLEAHYIALYALENRFQKRFLLQDPNKGPTYLGALLSAGSRVDSSLFYCFALNPEVDSKRLVRTLAKKYGSVLYLDSSAVIPRNSRLWQVNYRSGNSIFIRPLLGENEYMKGASRLLIETLRMTEIEAANSGWGN